MLPADWEVVEDSPFAASLFATYDEQVAAWERLKQRLTIGSILTGRIVMRTRFGVFFDAGLQFPVLMEIPDFATKSPMIFPDDYPALNSTISGRIGGFRDLEHQVQVGRLSAD